MNKKIRASSVVLITVILLLALIVPVQAGKRTDNFHVDLVQLEYGDDPQTAAGGYTITYNGDHYGAGDAFITNIPRNPGVRQGTLVLSDEGGSSQMVIRFSMYWIGTGLLAWCDDLGGLGGVAQYNILDEHNVGSYNLMGNGTFELCNVNRVGTGYLDGWAAETNPLWP